MSPWDPKKPKIMNLTEINQIIEKKDEHPGFPNNQIKQMVAGYVLSMLDSF